MNRPHPLPPAEECPSVNTDLNVTVLYVRRSAGERTRIWIRENQEQRDRERDWEHAGGFDQSGSETVEKLLKSSGTFTEKNPLLRSTCSQSGSHPPKTLTE